MFRDGPLTLRARETIRYGTGRCALGALLVASSARGIVSIMVRDTQSRLIRDLGARFPKANLVRDEKGRKATLAKVGRYIAAPYRPFAIRAVASSCSRSWFAFAVPCHRVLHTGRARKGRQYEWVEYEAKLMVACRAPGRLGR